tara:strand:- start:279 stop:695 length:417 start_codon:yes stop_codon:yes gene_type:complete
VGSPSVVLIEIGLEADPSALWGYENIVGTHVATPHVPVAIELPMLIAVGAVPMAGFGVLPLVFETHRDAVIGETPEFFLQSVVEFDRPLSRKEIFDRITALEELVSVSPFGIECVGLSDRLRITSIPGILSRLDFCQS